MQVPIEVTFSNIDKSDAVEELIRSKVKKMEKSYHDITSCHVYLDKPHKRKDKIFEVRLEVRVPGSDFAVSGNPGGKNDHTDINIAIRDTFKAMEKQLATRKHKFAKRRHTALGASEE
jgi:ribosomal subunit interface protein